MSYADPSDVAVELGRPVSSITPEESAQWQHWLDRVERSIERGFRRAGLVLETQIALGDPTEEDVIDVEVAAVVRKVDMPKAGRTSTTRSVDDATVTDRWEGEFYGLELTDDEWSTLLPEGDVITTDAFSTRPSFQPDRSCVDSGWWPYS